MHCGDSKRNCWGDKSVEKRRSQYFRRGVLDIRVDKILTKYQHIRHLRHSVWYAKYLTYTVRKVITGAAIGDAEGAGAFRG